MKELIKQAIAEKKAGGKKAKAESKAADAKVKKSAKTEKVETTDAATEEAPKKATRTRKKKDDTSDAPAAE